MTKSERIPVCNVRGPYYLVGLSQLNFAIKGDYLLVEVDGRWERFASYLIQNKERIRNQLAVVALSREISIQECINGQLDYNPTEEPNMIFTNKPSVAVSSRSKNNSLVLEKMDNHTPNKNSLLPPQTDNLR